MRRPLLPARQDPIAQLARPQLLTDVGDGRRLLMRVLLMVVLRANGVCYRVQPRRGDALAQVLVVQLEGLRRLLMMLV